MSTTSNAESDAARAAASERALAVKPLSPSKEATAAASPVSKSSSMTDTRARNTSCEPSERGAQVDARAAVITGRRAPAHPSSATKASSTIRGYLTQYYALVIVYGSGRRRAVASMKHREGPAIGTQGTRQAS